ncbi:YCF48-related protein [Balneolaceae bacterium ANBcel3]|nr:YCF48-related protein [Balneolaceae bacterium ANBcel3]
MPKLTSLILTFLLAATIPVITLAQSQQVELFDTGYSERIYDIKIIGDDRILAVGSNGLILISDDSGQSWEKYDSSDSYYYHKILFVDDSIGWIQGPDKLLMTIDSGSSWTDITPDLSEPYRQYDISFIDVNTGWIYGQHEMEFAIYHTFDGGDSWSKLGAQKSTPVHDKKQMSPEVMLSLAPTAGIQFLDEDTGWSYLFNALARTSDQGENWEIVEIDQSYIRDMYFADSQNGWFLGNVPISNFRFEGNIFATIDGGETWESQLAQDGMLSAISFHDNNHGWALGNFRQVYFTNNGGTNWYAVEDTLINDYSTVSIAATDETTAWITTNEGVLLRVTNPELITPADAEPDIAQRISLNQNYPNPFNPVTVISFELSEAQPTQLSVYDVLGRKIEVLIDTNLPSGSHSVSFDATNLSSGIYLYKLQVGSQLLTRSMTLIK